MRAAHATAALRLDVQRFNACTGVDSAWTTKPRSVRLDVVATSPPVTSRSLVFDHEGSWTSLRTTGWSRSRDGGGTYDVVGAWHRSFDVGGVVHWGRNERSHAQRDTR
jgi:hypothetical protein